MTTTVREPVNGLTGLSIVCPITSRIKGYPFEIVVPAGLPITGVVLSDQVKSLDCRARRAELIVTLPAAVVAEVLVKIRALL
jgi:mRNA interferase MazF